jgi:outer membrane protein assembly factor BamB
MVDLDRLGAREHDALLCELGTALLSLVGSQRARVRVPLGGDAGWELALLADRDSLFVSLYSSAGAPHVLLLEHRTKTYGLARALASALSRARGDGVGDWVRQRLEELSPAALTAAAPEPTLITIEPTGDLPLVIAADVLLRVYPHPVGSDVAQSELAPLLFRGALRLSLGEHERALRDVLVFVAAETIVTLLDHACEPSQAGKAFQRVEPAGELLVGLRVEWNGQAALTLKSTSARRSTWTFPAVELDPLRRSVVAFGRALYRGLVRRDRSLAQNLRLGAFRDRVRSLSDRKRQFVDESLVNASPASYRAYGDVRPSAPPLAPPSRLRYSLAWTATVPLLDLRSTFLCGPVLVACGMRDLGCLDAATGHELWRREAPRAASIVTPRGLARIETSGKLTVFDLEDGTTRWSTQLRSRPRGSVSGTVVSAPGLPKLLVLADGRSVTALDLDTGHVGWRFSPGREGTQRIRRAGRLLVVAGGTQDLTALDVVSGEVVWRFCDSTGFSSSASLASDDLFVVAGAGAAGWGSARLHELDPWAGSGRRAVVLPPSMSPVGAPLVAHDTVVVVAHDARGTSLLGFERGSLSLKYERRVTATASSCMMVDNTVCVNAESGELVGVDASTGEVLYRRLLGTGGEGERPRRLEPVLRSGVLFVPQSHLYVIRPRDGHTIAQVPTDLVPDFVRVDERCGVVVAEESGYLASFVAGARLSVV